MKKLIFILSLLLMGNVTHSQTIPGVNASQHKEYVMKTYKVDNQKADEYEQLLSSLNEEFCKDVQPLFQAANYTKWHGWWKYSFERKMKRKGIK